MLVTDPLTGQLHEVPDYDSYGGWDGWGHPSVDPQVQYSGYGGPGVPQQIVYDGFGNPLGAWPVLAAILPAVASALPALVRGLTGGRQGGMSGWTPGLAEYEPHFGYAYCGPADAYGNRAVYDGFGNPVGSIPAIASIVSQAAPAIARAFPRVAQAVGHAVPAITQALPQVARAFREAMPPMGPQTGPAMAAPMAPMPVGPGAMDDEAAEEMAPPAPMDMPPPAVPVPYPAPAGPPPGARRWGRPPVRRVRRVRVRRISRR